MHLHSIVIASSRYDFVIVIEEIVLLAQNVINLEEPTHLRQIRQIRKAAESESRSELESVGVDCFVWSRSRSWSRKNFADSDSYP